MGLARRSQCENNSATIRPSTGFLLSLLAFAAGFIVRPFGAVFFGRLGDLVGRKYSFLVTMLLMGLATMVWSNFGAAQGRLGTRKRNRSNDLD
jgi:MFS family permease